MKQEQQYIDILKAYIDKKIIEYREKGTKNGILNQYYITGISQNMNIELNQNLKKSG
jgi:hypothetical protein